MLTRELYDLLELTAEKIACEDCEYRDVTWYVMPCAVCNIDFKASHYKPSTEFKEEFEMNSLLDKYRTILDRNNVVWEELNDITWKVQGREYWITFYPSTGNWRTNEKEAVSGFSIKSLLKLC